MSQTSMPVLVVNDHDVMGDYARRVAATRIVYTISGEDGLARIAAGPPWNREATLCWSAAGEAERLRRQVARNGRLNPIMLGNFHGAVLPKLRSLNRMLVPDWDGGRCQPQFEITDVEQSLRGETLRAALARIAAGGRLFILESDLGPAFATSTIVPGGLVLPCWPSADDAECQLRGFWADMMVSEISLESLLTRMLPWLAEMGRQVSLEHGLGGIAMELRALDMAGRLMQHRASQPGR